MFHKKVVGEVLVESAEIGSTKRLSWKRGPWPLMLVLSILTPA